MPRDPARPPAISAKAILSAMNEIRRHGHWPLFQQLEHEEPELAEQVLEGVSAIHQSLLESRAPPRVVRRLQRQIQSLVLVTVLSVRAAHEPAKSTPDDSHPPGSSSTQGDPCDDQGT